MDENEKMPLQEAFLQYIPLIMRGAEVAVRVIDILGPATREERPLNAAERKALDRLVAEQEDEWADVVAHAKERLGRD